MTQQRQNRKRRENITKSQSSNYLLSNGRCDQKWLPIAMPSEWHILHNFLLKMKSSVQNMTRSEESTINNKYNLLFNKNLIDLLSVQLHNRDPTNGSHPMCSHCTCVRMKIMYMRWIACYSICDCVNGTTNTRRMPNKPSRTRMRWTHTNERAFYHSLNISRICERL